MKKETSEVMPTRTPCTDCPLRALDYFRKFSETEFDFVQSFKVGELCVGAGGTIAEEGSRSDYLYTVLDGWAFRYKTLSDGSRQILNFALSGDFIGLQTSVFGAADHSVDALTDTTLCLFSRKEIWTLFHRHPALGFDLTWLAAKEEKVLGAHLTTVGQRSARSAVAFLLLHLRERCNARKVSNDHNMVVPFTQQHLADLLGLSLVHTNKTLKRMQSEGLLTWDRGAVTFLDTDALVRIAEFDEDRRNGRPFL